ncbi:MAG: MFS transporter [Saprospiraceae bacterium]
MKNISLEDGQISKYHWTLFIICFLGTAFAGISSTLMSVYMPTAIKDLIGLADEEEMNKISAYINAVFILGGSIGGIICGYLSDQFGRKKGLIISIACYGLFTLLTAVMPSWFSVVICRFLSGFGLGGVLVSSTTLMMEEWPIKSRASFMGFLSISIPIGIFSAGVIDYFISSWRIAFIIGIFPITLAIISIWILKESNKWLENKKEILNQTVSKDSIFSKIYINNLLLGTIIFGTMLIGLWAIFLWLPTWIQTFFIDKDAAKERGLSMMVLGLGGLTGGILSGSLINRLGAKKSLLLCFIICSFISIILFKTNTNFSPIIYFEISILSFFFGASQGVLSVYIPELFPVNIRATATGFCFNAGRIFTAFAVLFVGVLVTELGGYSNSLFIFSLVFLLGLCVTFFAPDTSPYKKHSVSI